MAIDPRIALMTETPNLGQIGMQGYQQGVALADLGRQRQRQEQADIIEAANQRQQMGLRQQQLQLQQQQQATQAEQQQQQNAASALGLIARAARSSKTPEDFQTNVDMLSELGVIKPDIAARYRGAFDQREAIAAWADKQAGENPASFREYQLAQSDPEYGKFLNERRAEAQADKLALAGANKSGRTQTVTTADGVFEVNEDGSLGRRYGAAPRQAGSGPAPAAIIKLEREDREDANLLSGMNQQLGRFIDQIDNGELSLGPASNLVSRGLNFAGTSTENSRNFASFQASLEKLRNDSLRLNKGVQTEGDSQRAWNELVANINDPGVVRQRLTEIMALNERAAALRNENLSSLYEQYPSLGAAAEKATEPAAAPTATPSNLPKPPPGFTVIGD